MLYTLTISYPALEILLPLLCMCIGIFGLGIFQEKCDKKFLAKKDLKEREKLREELNKNG